MCSMYIPYIYIYIYIALLSFGGCRVCRCRMIWVRHQAGGWVWATQNTGGKRLNQHFR